MTRRVDARHPRGASPPVRARIFQRPPPQLRRVLARPHPARRRRRNGAPLRHRQPQPEHEAHRVQVQGKGQSSLHQSMRPSEVTSASTERWGVLGPGGPIGGKLQNAPLPHPDAPEAAFPFPRSKPEGKRSTDNHQQEHERAFPVRAGLDGNVPCHNSKTELGMPSHAPAGDYLCLALCFRVRRKGRVISLDEAAIKRGRIPVHSPPGLFLERC